MSTLDQEVSLVMNALCNAGNAANNSPKSSECTTVVTNNVSPSVVNDATPWYQLSETELERFIQTNLTPEQVNELKQLMHSLNPDEKDSCDVQLKHPFSMIVSGPSKSGKTYLTSKILQSGIIQPESEKVLWCYSQWQPMYGQMKEDGLVDKFIEGLNYEDEIDGTTPTLLVIDDLQNEGSNNEAVAKLFMIGCHHSNLSVIFLVQNLFFQGKQCRNITTNANYVVIFKNPADKMQINRFAQKAFPGQVASFMNLYDEICSRPHGYLLLDFTQDCHDATRIRTGITDGETLQCFSLD